VGHDGRRDGEHCVSSDGIAEDLIKMDENVLLFGFLHERINIRDDQIWNLELANVNVKPCIVIDTLHSNSRLLVL
jgi:hypothetical protein